MQPPATTIQVSEKTPGAESKEAVAAKKPVNSAFSHSWTAAAVAIFTPQSCTTGNSLITLNLIPPRSGAQTLATARGNGVDSESYSNENLRDGK